MEVQINNYIDFGKLFLDLFKENEDDLEQYKFEANYYNTILTFKNGAYADFDLELDECEFGDKEITWVYTRSFNDANESDTRSATAEFIIIYDRIISEFTACDYEQG